MARAIACVWGECHVRILMLGNSLTTAHGMPDTLSDITGAEVVVHARGGARLAEHLNPSTRLGALTQQALREDRWDYVVLQEASTGPIRTRKAYLRSVTALARQAREANAEPLILATWPFAAGSAKLKALGLSRPQMGHLLEETFAEAAAVAGARVADACHSFLDARDADALYMRDGVHPSEIGSALVAKAIAQVV